MNFFITRNISIMEGIVWPWLANGKLSDWQFYPLQANAIMVINCAKTTPEDFLYLLAFDGRLPEFTEPRVWKEIQILLNVEQPPYIKWLRGRRVEVSMQYWPIVDMTYCQSLDSPTKQIIKFMIEK